MKYTIISIDDSRQDFKDKIRKEMAGYEEVFLECLDARPVELDLGKELYDRGLSMAPFWKNLMWKRGDLGGFVSHYNTWKYCASSGEPLIVFEDDAIVPVGFMSNVLDLLTEVPKDYGVVSLCANTYGQGFYNMRVQYNEYGQHFGYRPLEPDEDNQFDYGAERMTRAYQSWTQTATLYSPAAAQSLVDTVQRMGIHMNADAFIYHRAHVGDFDAYAPKPEFLYMVAEFYEGHSLIQSAEH